jgi:hypothetical protein
MHVIERVKDKKYKRQHYQILLPAVIQKPHHLSQHPFLIIDFVNEH